MIAQSQPPTKAVEIRSVSKIYDNGLTAVAGLSFDIHQGEIFGLLGPNGAGKSTLIGMISGLIRITKGEILVFGKNVVSDYQQTRSSLGITPQEVAIDNFLSVGDCLSIHAGYYGRADDPEWRQLLIDKLDLRPHLNKKPLQLSGGMKRRLMIAKSLIHRPKVLILDEPTAGVDVELRHALWGFVRELRNQGLTILLTTHYIEEAQELCDRVGIINAGQLIALENTKVMMSQFGKSSNSSLEDVYLELTKKETKKS